MKPKVFSTNIAEVNDEVQLRLSKVEDRLLAVRDRIKGILARINTTRPTLNITSSTPQAPAIAATHPDQTSVMRDSVRLHFAGSSIVPTATIVPRRAPRKSCTPRQRQVSSVEFYFRPKIIPPQ